LLFYIFFINFRTFLLIHNNTINFVFKAVSYRNVIGGFFICQKTGGMIKMGVNNEIDRWREEYYFKLQDCKKAIMGEYALSHAYNSHTLKEFMEQLIRTYGLEHVSLLLSNTIREATWDRRYSNNVRAWVNHYPTIRQPPVERKEPMRFSELYLNEHPVILNQAALIAMQKEKELAHPKRKEPER